MPSLFLIALFLFQNPSGNVRGRVLDPSGAPAAQVQVELVSETIQRTTRTNPAGIYWFPDAPAGSYSIRVQAPGFAAAQSAAFDVSVGGSVSIDFTLALAERRDAVTVEAPLVELNHGEASRVLTAQELKNTGLAGRNAFLALALLPGVSARAGYFQGDFRGFSQSTGPVQINGQRKDTTLVTLDGINHTEPRAMTRTNSNPGIDFVDEVTVLSTHYAAEFGRTTGAQVHYVTRRGGADIHASAWEYLLHDKLIAQQFVIGGRPRTRYHNFGWTASGPVPGYRKKLFFFAGQEFRRLGGFEQRTVTVPTALERQRDFSRSAVRPVDPLAGNTPFPGDVIPASRLSRFGQALLRIYPEPNWTGLGGNYYAIRPAPQFLTDTTARVDYQFSPRWHLYTRALHSKQDATSGYSQTGNLIPLFEINQARYGNNYTVALNTAIDERTSNQFQAGYADFRDRINIVDGGANRSRFGLDGIAEFYPGNRENRIPNIFVGGYQMLSGSGHPTFAATPTYSVRNNFARQAGAHSLKAGAYLELPRVNQINQSNDNGTFVFQASAFNPRNSRNPLAAALLGYYDQYGESTGQVQTPYRTRIVEFFAQDSWRARRNLSIEAGLRYSLLPPWWSAWNNIAAFQVSAFDRARVPRINPNGTLVPGSGDRYNGVVLPGDGWPDTARGRVPIAASAEFDRLFRGRPRGLVNTNWGNVQPRLSFAWDPFGNGRTAVRGGGGVFNGPPALTTGGFQLGGLAPFVESIVLANGDADNPVGGIPNNAVFPLDVAALPERARTPTIYSYSFGIQQQLPSRVVVDASYVGNVGRFLLQSRPLNFIPLDVQRANIGRDIRDLLPFPGLQGIGLTETSATSSYNSLQVAMNKRMTRGLQVRLAYTWAKAMGYTVEGVSPAPQDPANLRLERSELEESRRHNLVITHLVELPKLRGRPMWLRQLAAGWTWSGTVVVNSGRRFDLTINAATGQVATRPDVRRNPNLPAGQRTLAAYFDTGAFTRPPAFTYGNAGRMLLTGPGTLNYDASLAKSFPLGERLRLEVRGEFFNATNHPNPNGFVTQFGNRAFGQVNSFAPPRYAQVSARVNW